MLSLSPRFDLFHFEFPKNYFPQEVLDKYQKILDRNVAVLTNVVDYVNESIQGITMPGIQDTTITQEQHSHNPIERKSHKINVEPAHDNTYYSTANPLKMINKEFTVTMRQNQGLLNYFMMYETMFHRICKNILYKDGEDVFYIDILNELGFVTARIKLFQPRMKGIDGLDFTYSKTDRAFETFNVVFDFNNIDFDILDNVKK